MHIQIVNMKLIFLQKLNLINNNLAAEKLNIAKFYLDKG